MADITMCKGNYCEIRETCYRYKAEPTPRWQSYFTKPPSSTSYDCEYYWEINHTEQTRIENNNIISEL